MIGILGGMGTQAGLDFCNKLAMLNRGKIDQKYPLFILYNKSNIPKRPENEQGILTLPPPSVPIDKGPIPDATADADPPEEPPDVQSKFHGFLVIPVRGL